MPETSSNGADAPYHPVDRAFRSTVGRESTAFGFSILVTVTFGIVQHHHGAPATRDLVLYALGAVASFTILELILSRGMRAPMPQHNTGVVAVGTALNFISVGGGLAAAFAVANLVSGDLAWPLCPLAAALSYLVLESLELLAAERFHLAVGDDEARVVED